ncbi:MAG TPA: ABC transporter permease subunit [Terracidiphilus sp.]|nr:ABC transporter permease subunit [Terracidiphilus sp.]
MRFVAIVKWMARMLAILLLVMTGTTILVRYAPGYLSDERELDAHYAQAARAQLAIEASRSRSLKQMLSTEMDAWFHGDFGRSRQFDVPVQELIGPRLGVTGGLLLRSLFLGWLFAICASVFSSAGRNPSVLWQIPATLVLAAPAAAMATLCLITGKGGPVLVMALLIAARDFKFLHGMLRKAWLEPHVLQARAQGIATRRLLVTHVLPSVAGRLGILASLSLVTALSALVPVEVIFNVPGLGQLAWTAALNRDLPVLLAITLIMAVAVTCSGLAPAREPEWERA